MRRKTHREKALEGTLRGDRGPQDQAQPAAGRAEAPDWLSSDQAAEFRHLVDLVESTGTPTASFVAALTGAAIAAADVRRLSMFITEHGSSYQSQTTTGAAKWVYRPEAAQLNAAQGQFRKYLSELGITPRALVAIDRARMPSKPEGRRNPFAELDREYDRPRPRLIR